jgi:hypothetical protein
VVVLTLMMMSLVISAVVAQDVGSRHAVRAAYERAIFGG